ncbi:unnamed protein product, partial [Heligmosomoides polygyrus]|uniref:Secreted protein n=1 Tax=Heligmosomoides polygyrus TaxID=6339 RepID=A0A183FCE8_HELPZ
MYPADRPRRLLHFVVILRATTPPPPPHNADNSAFLEDATVRERADGQLRKENTGCDVWRHTLVVWGRESAEHRANHPRRERITHIYKQA